MLVAVMNVLVKFMDIALVLSSFFWLAPYSKDFDIVLPCRIYALFRLMWLMYNRKLNVTLQESVILSILTIPPLIFFGLQSIILQSLDNAKAGLGSVSFLLAAFYIYKSIGVKQYFKYLFMFSLVNLASIFIWALLGTPEVIHTPENGRHSYTYVLSFLTINQYVNYDMSLVGDWFTKVRFCGFTSNQNTIGICSALGMFYLAFEKMSTKKILASWLAFGLILLLTQSRAAFLFVMVYFIGRYFFHNNLSAVKVVRLATMILLLAVIGSVLNELRGTGTDMSSSRVFFMETLWKIYSENNIINQLVGIGYRNIREFLWVDSGIDWLSPDNSYIPILVETGIIGFVILYASMLLAYLYACTRDKKGIMEGMPFLLALFSYSFFENLMFFTHMSYFYLVYLFYLCDIKRSKLAQ